VHWPLFAYWWCWYHQINLCDKFCLTKEVAVELIASLFRRKSGGYNSLSSMQKTECLATSIPCFISLRKCNFKELCPQNNHKTTATGVYW
jgi:hypothetical protein